MSASFGGLNIGKNKNNRRVTPYSNTPATHGITQNSQRSFADSVSNLFEPSPLLYPSQVNLENQ